jgi:hypothetical protein
MEHAFSEKVGQDWLKSLLAERVVAVVFTKADGTEREMNATLQDSVLPEVQKELGSDAPVRAKSKDALAVWDVDAQGWRSFRWDSIKSVRFDLGE